MSDCIATKLAGLECAPPHSYTAPMQHGPFEWDDLRIVLAIARSGSALRASQQLGVNQTTVLRRLDALEAAIGTELFARRKTGLTLTPAGRLVAEAAERMAAEVEALASILSARQRAVAGNVRLTTSDVLAVHLVTPCLQAFHQQYPGVAIEVISTDRRLDIARGEADVALRGSSRPEGAGIVAQRLPDAPWTIYCSRDYAARRGAPHDRQSIPGHDIVGLEGQMAQINGWAWLQASAPDAVIRVRSNSLFNLVSYLKTGLGLGVLPALVGDAEPDLIRCFPPPCELEDELWLIVREDIKSQPHIRALTDFLAGYIRRTLAHSL